MENQAFLIKTFVERYLFAGRLCLWPRVKLTGKQTKTAWKFEKNPGFNIALRIGLYSHWCQAIPA
ncbi:hypothetical protein IM774_09930 [Erysipelotrichaceae bacterium RD49]|nr:hypothetical protein [Erysipelotrichaceae bacterium RD49]